VTDRPVFGEVDGGVIQRTGESADLADEVVMSLLVSWVIRIALRLHHLLFTHTKHQNHVHLSVHISETQAFEIFWQVFRNDGG